MLLNLTRRSTDKTYGINYNTTKQQQQAKRKKFSHRIRRAQCVQFFVSICDANAHSKTKQKIERKKEKKYIQTRIKQ